MTEIILCLDGVDHYKVETLDEVRDLVKRRYGRLKSPSYAGYSMSQDKLYIAVLRWDNTHDLGPRHTPGCQLTMWDPCSVRVILPRKRTETGSRNRHPRAQPGDAYGWWEELIAGME